MEEEQEFVSSLVTQGRGRRKVHWDDLPNHKTRDQPEQVSLQQQDAQSGKRPEDVQRVDCGEKTPAEDKVTLKSQLLKIKDDDDNQRMPLNTVNTNGDQTSQDVEKATYDLQLCSLSNAARERAACPESLSGNQDNQQAASANANICHVGISKRGAAAVRDHLGRHDAAPKPDTLRLKLLAGLRRTFEEWCTAATQQFLYGTGQEHCGPSPKVSPDSQEEELDEDDLADEETDMDGQAASGKVADYEKLQEEVQQQEQRVRGFYKRTWIPPEKVEDSPGDKVSG